ncbi:hypothetical protein SSPO_079260 [Streptomyces antimycoticus]|uniref:Cation-transporting P-type ATPase C-terminal domain-containing protein n=1 Tax=Streptomyces antimycoticus TaxID=68175 RepID=A0A499UYS3_9ACTN|nr:cation transporting ATPase C-terminal domain-containing protein [Streptomyces antimycoticus]BBJ45208.1 hypothetical protein SSPO_079260 [Streptomyces antimycoticus]
MSAPCRSGAGSPEASIPPPSGCGRRCGPCDVRRFLLYALAGGTAEIPVMLLGPFLGMPLLLLPAQILWISLLTHGLPGVALGAEPGAPDVMRHPPRPPEESVLGAGLWPRILAMGAFVATRHPGGRGLGGRPAAPGSP